MGGRDYRPEKRVETFEKFCRWGDFINDVAPPFFIHVTHATLYGAILKLVDVTLILYQFYILSILQRKCNIL
jgi:hypothetical protein